MTRLTNFTLALVATFIIVYTLVVGKSFFLPIVIAFVIGYLIISVVEGVEMLSIKGRRLPRFLASIVAFLLIVTVLMMVFSMISGNFAALLEVAPQYQERLAGFLSAALNWLNLPVQDLTSVFKNLDFVNVLSKIVVMLTDVAANAGMIAVYVLFILIEYQFFDEKLARALPHKQAQDSTKKILHKISGQIQSYILLKTFISLITALLCYTVLVLVGVDFPEFWAFLIFLLNYIPTIGSIIAVTFPCLLTLVQFDSLFPFVQVTAGLIIVEFFMGNVIEPRVMGKRFNLSGLVIILSLTIWGQIWGVVGMFLCVPLVMIMSIIMANFSKTRPVAIMLSREGRLD